jgi:hypothetical protein
MKSVIWCDIEGYENEYQINQFGEIRTLKNSPKLKKFDTLKPQLSKSNGYMYQMLYKNGKPKLVRIHRLVAKAFVPNPNNFTQINHIDGNKQNNNASNLEWCDQPYNMKHAYKTGLQKPSEKQKEAIRNTNKLKRKKVVQLKDGKVINTFSSMSEASRKTNITTSLISRCCNLKRKSTNGYEWRFV